MEAIRSPPSECNMIGLSQDYSKADTEEQDDHQQPSQTSLKKSITGRT